MTTHRRYRALDSDPFGELVRMRELAGFRLDPAAPREVWDVYADTPEAQLLRSGLVLRLRKHGDTLTGSLRAGEAGEEIASARWTNAGTLSSVPELPDGDLRARVAESCDPASLVCILRFHQYRTPRAIFDGDRLAGVLSLDVVADQTDPAVHSVSSEVELELTGRGTTDDLQALDTALQRIGFITDNYSKFERGVIRFGADENRTLLLLPSERSALEESRETGSGVERRRSEVILLAADGVSEEEISQRVGLAASRVQHWVESFRAQRMKAIDPAAPDPSLAEEGADQAPVYRVSEVVEGSGASIRIEREEPPQELRRFMSVFRPTPPPAGTDRNELDTGAAEQSGDKEFSGDGEPLAHPSDRTEESHADHDQNLAEVDASPHEEVEHSGRGETHSGSSFDGLLGMAKVSLTQSRREAASSLANWVMDQLTSLSAHPDDDSERDLLERALIATHVAELVDALSHNGLDRESASELRSCAIKFRRVVSAARGLARSRARLDISPPQAGGVPVAIALATTVWTVDLRRILQERTPALNELTDVLRSVFADNSRTGLSEERTLGSVLPELLWIRYGHLRGVAEAGSIPADLPELEVRTDAMLLALSVIEGGNVDSVKAGLVRLRDNLELVSTEADLALQLDGFISDWIVPGAAADPEPLRRRREAAEEAAVGAMAGLEASLAEIQSHEFRRLLGEVAASV